MQNHSANHSGQRVAAMENRKERGNVVMVNDVSDVAESETSLWAMEVVFGLLADGRALEEVPAALRQVLDLVDNANQGQPPADLLPADLPPSECSPLASPVEDLALVLSRCGVRSGSDLRA